jgi:hypothetical protein
MEVRMPIRLAVLVVLLAFPSFSQQPSPQTRVQYRIAEKSQWHDELNTGAAATDQTAAARLQAIHREADELSALNAAVQADLLQFHKGLLGKDMHEHLKQLEKLSKKLRRDIEP